MKFPRTRSVIPFTSILLLGCATASTDAPRGPPVLIAAEKNVARSSEAPRDPSTSVREATGPSDLSGHTVVVLTARWCAACHAQLNRIGFVGLLFGDRVQFVSVDIDRNPFYKELQELLPEKTVSGVPTLLFLADGRLLGSVTGVLSVGQLTTRVRAAYPGDLDPTAARTAIHRVAERMRLDDPDARAGSWLSLVALAESGIPSEYLFSALCVLVDLFAHGDEQQRHLASLALQELTKAIEAQGAPRVRFEFSGNSRLPDTELESELRRQGFGALVFWAETWLQALYLRRGFRDADADATLSYDAKTGLTLRFDIREGAAYTVDRISIVTCDDSAKRQESTAFRASPGVTHLWNRDEIRAISSRAVAKYRQKGHYDATSEPLEQCDAARRCDVVICVQLGPVYQIGKVVISESSSMEAHFDAHRYLKALSLRSGAVYSDTALSAARKRVLLLPEVYEVNLWTDSTEDLRVDVHYELSFEP